MSSSALSRWTVARGRWRFVHGIQSLAPKFFELLQQDVWRNSDPCALSCWLRRMGIKDPWLVQIIQDTLDEWTACPESPAARLEKGVYWFYYREPLETWRFREFTPALVKAHPVATGDRLLWESREEFARRMRSQFDRQLADYMAKDYIGDFFSEPPNRARDIEWTVARFLGCPIQEIIRESLRAGREGKSSGLSNNNKDMQQVVYRSVRRFADEIGLTLPGCTKTQGKECTKQIGEKVVNMK